MSTAVPTRRPTPAPVGSGRPRPAAPVWLALVATSLPLFMATLDNLVMTGALPVISQHLHPSVEQLQWFVNAYTLTFATLMIPLATLGDRLGRRRTFVAGIVVFALGSIGSALSTDPTQLIAARTLQGLGGAAIMPLSLALLAGAVPASRRAMAIGISGGVSGLGVALGPVVGGAVVDGLSWQGIFWLNVPVAVVAIPLVLRGLPESARTSVRLDVTGLVLSAAGVLLGVWAIVGANDRGWGSATTVGMLVAAAVLLVGFVLQERRAAHPLVPLRLFRSRSFSVANVAGFAFSMGMFGAVFLLTQYLQIGGGYSPFAAGVRTLPWTAAPMVVAPIAGALSARFGVRPFVSVGLVLQAVALGWLALLVGPDLSYPSVVPAFVLAGVGMGMTFAPVSTAILAGQPERDHATASSVNATIREVGVALGVAVLTAVFLAGGGAFTPATFADGLTPALWVGTAVVAAGAAVSFLMPRSTGKER